MSTFCPLLGREFSNFQFCIRAHDGKLYSKVCNKLNFLYSAPLLIFLDRRTGRNLLIRNGLWCWRITASVMPLPNYSLVMPWRLVHTALSPRDSRGPRSSDLMTPWPMNVPTLWYFKKTNYFQHMDCTSLRSQGSDKNRFMVTEDDPSRAVDNATLLHSPYRKSERRSDTRSESLGQNVTWTKQGVD